MSRPSTAEVFIRTLTELRDADRATHMSWSHERQTAEAAHSARTFWAGIDDSLRLSNWRLPGRPAQPETTQGTTRQSQRGDPDESRVVFLHAGFKE